MHWQLLTAVLVVAAPAPADNKKDTEKIQGSWTVVSFTHAGTEGPNVDVTKIKVTVKDDTLTINDGRRDEVVKFKLDPAKKPKTIDLTVEAKKDEQVPGIYELKDDELKICFAKGGGERPTEFASKTGTTHTLIVFKREKKDKDK
jgi:uncharacterized protein (TIGR03067 family)